MGIKTIQNRIVGDQNLLGGVKKHIAKADHLVIDGEKFGAAEISSLLQGRIDTAVTVTAAHAAWRAAALEGQKSEVTTRKTVSAIRQTLLIMFASKPDVLKDFGLSPRRATRALTAVETVQKTEKAKATRKARHTLGPRQKAKVKGNMNGEAVATATPEPLASPPANGSTPRSAANGS
jgi:hypothetical protein